MNIEAVATRAETTARMPHPPGQDIDPAPDFYGTTR
jgi:hypothetical protein